MPMTATHVDFISNHPAMRVLRATAQERLLQNGNVAVTKPELCYEFQDRRLSVRLGQDVLPDKVDPDTGEIVEQDAVEYLRTHPDFNNRFYEITPEVPDPGPLFEQITTALLSEDVAALTAIGDEEHATFNRDEIMDLVKAALDKLEPKD